MDHFEKSLIEKKMFLIKCSNNGREWFGHLFKKNKIMKS